jgi:hypothetical protein
MENEFEKKLGNLKTPGAEFVKHQGKLKVGLMNARRSSRIGLVFILVPALFLLIAYIKLQFILSIDFQATFQEIIHKTDHASWLRWVVPVVFLVLPLLSVIINLLAVSHFFVDKQSKEIIITFQYRLKNLIVLIVGLVIIIAFWCFIILGYVHFK